MDNVTVKRTDLLEKLKENRTNHSQLYKDAVEGFFTDTKKKLEKALARIEKNEIISSVSVTQPTDHTEKYDEAIAMLEMSVSDEIELRSSEFNNYVLDKWVSQAEKNMLRNLALSSSNGAFYINN